VNRFERVCITVPASLHARMKVERRKFNWSAVASEAFAKAIEGANDDGTQRTEPTASRLVVADCRP
jgi:hypothetical protein